MKNHRVVLITPNEEINTPASIIYNKESSEVKIGIYFQGKEIWGYGKDYLWVDAFADLQKHLPEGVILKCCMTCRYGNMCPYGNVPGELFCTEDLAITSKNDMCNLFDNEKEYAIEKRSRNCTDNCEKYQHQSWDFYTYNDYLYALDK